jgi:hypothetical protein
MNYRMRRLMAGMIALAAGIMLITIEAGAQQATDAPRAAATLVWPNTESKANSDDWIRLHHSEIRQMQPRVLVLNFVNGLSTDEAKRKVDRLIAAVKESSRYHGYKNANAPAFLDYQLYKIVDLTDPQQLPEAARMDGNSTKYPRVPDWKEGLNFRYDALFSDEYARMYQVPDPDSPARFLTLSEMVNKGIIHEVWFLALQGKYGAPLESVEVKQAYDRNMRKIPGRSVQAGNGGTDEQPFIGRSLRILFINSERGPGCAMESLGHSLEGTSNSNAIPYFTRYFTEYAGFDLKKRYHLPFDSLYGRDGNEFDYPDKDTMVYTWKGEKISVHPYIPIGGSVHFMPTARRDYDLDNSEVVLSTIEHYRLRDGLDGNDKPEEWYADKFRRYRQLANDCQGPWVVYWRQNMPGLDNPCKDDNGKPMLNWWPFLFY